MEGQQQEQASLGLTDEQYARYLRFMDKDVSELPGALKINIHRAIGLFGLNGDAITLAIAEWVKTHPTE